jgi:hypothetical protein
MERFYDGAVTTVGPLLFHQSMVWTLSDSTSQ